MLIPDRDKKTITLYSLTGEAGRRIPCLTLTDADTWLCEVLSRGDTVIVSCNYVVSCVDVSTRSCVWATGSLEKPTAVCCDDDDRVYVAVGGYSDTLQIAVLNCKTGETALFLVDVCLCLSIPASISQHLMVTVSVCQCLFVPVSACQLPDLLIYLQQAFSSQTHLSVLMLS